MGESAEQLQEWERHRARSGARGDSSDPEGEGGREGGGEGGRAAASAVVREGEVLLDESFGAHGSSLRAGVAVAAFMALIALAALAGTVCALSGPQLQQCPCLLSTMSPKAKDGGARCHSHSHPHHSHSRHRRGSRGSQEPGIAMSVFKRKVGAQEPGQVGVGNDTAALFAEGGRAVWAKGTGDDDNQDSLLLGASGDSGSGSSCSSEFDGDDGVPRSRFPDTPRRRGQPAV